jgi:hypothetical protein
VLWGCMLAGTRWGSCPVPDLVDGSVQFCGSVIRELVK